jgi:diguanylate cyclase (GGDEF)-like protein/PAS domain S-box-containing protein
MYLGILGRHCSVKVAGESVDRVTMDGEVLESETLDNALAALLERRHGSIGLALTDAAVRAPLPDDESFKGLAPLPGEHATVVDFVVPTDRMTVVSTWERAQIAGIAQGTVRLISEPERSLTLAIIDARHSWNVWIGLLIPDESWAAESGEASLNSALLVPTRPRTARLYKNLYGIITDIDDRVTGMLGWTREQIVGHRSLEFLHPDDHERAIGQWLEMRARQTTQRVRLRHRHANGSLIWVEVENAYVGMDDPDRLVAIAHLTDISDEMAAHEAVQQREKLFRRLAESLPGGLFQVGVDRTIAYANARLASILGVGGCATLAEQLSTIAESDHPVLEELFTAAFERGLDGQAEVEIRLPGGDEVRRCLFTVTALTDEEGAPGAIVSATDITQDARIREELRVRATYDPLTGCHNRGSAMARLATELEKPGALTVVFIDLDKFKPINDSYGHAVGDELLIEASRRIVAAARTEDIVARIGGDEFLLICRGIVDPVKAMAVGERVRAMLHGPVVVAGHTIELTASIGVAVSLAESSSDLLVAQADAAMYESKRRGAGLPVMFDAASTPGSASSGVTHQSQVRNSAQ